MCVCVCVCVCLGVCARYTSKYPSSIELVYMGNHILRIVCHTNTSVAMATGSWLTIALQEEEGEGIHCSDQTSPPQWDPGEEGRKEGRKEQASSTTILEDQIVSRRGKETEGLRVRLLSDMTDKWLNIASPAVQI